MPRNKSREADSRRQRVAPRPHARYFILQLAECHLTRPLFGQILRRVGRLRPGNAEEEETSRRAPEEGLRWATETLVDRPTTHSLTNPRPVERYLDAMTLSARADDSGGQ